MDIWAAGILLYVMLCGKFPFKANNDKLLYEKIKRGVYDIPDYVSNGARQIIENILIMDPKERLTSEEVKTLFL